MYKFKQISVDCVIWRLWRFFRAKTVKNRQKSDKAVKNYTVNTIRKIRIVLHILYRMKTVLLQVTVRQRARLSALTAQVRLPPRLTALNITMPPVRTTTSVLNRHIKLLRQASSYMYPPLRGGQADYGENQGRFSPEEAAFYRVKSERCYLGEEYFAQRTEKLRKMLCDGSTAAYRKDCRSHCRAGRSNCWVDWRGNMGMCGMIPAAEENNVLQHGFTACWENVKKEADGIRLPEKCAECKYSVVCNVCAAVCLCETGTYNTAPDYVCRYSRLVCENMMRPKGE